MDYHIVMLWHFKLESYDTIRRMAFVKLSDMAMEQLAQEDVTLITKFYLEDVFYEPQDRYGLKLSTMQCQFHLSVEQVEVHPEQTFTISTQGAIIPPDFSGALGEFSVTG